MSEVIPAEEIRAAAKAMLLRHATSERIRNLFDKPNRLDDLLWQQMSNLGWMGMEVPEEFGGLGGQFDDVVILLEELGRFAAGGPFMSTATLAIGALLLAGTESQRNEFLPRLAAGECLATAALCDAAGRPMPSVRWRTDPDSAIRLDGVVGFVPDAGIAEMIVVGATDAAGANLLVFVPRDRAGIGYEPTPVLDQTRSMWQITFIDCMVSAAEVMASGAAASDTLSRLFARASVAIAADSTGNARSVLDRTTTYAKERIQFGMPIGTFQGVKHQCANMFVGTEEAATLTTAAAEAITANSHDASELASMAKYYACRNAADAAGRGVQLHGGIGYTWEHDMHIYLKRAKLNEALFGDTRSHLRNVATSILGPVSAA